jgi:hypothetical protein
MCQEDIVWVGIMKTDVGAKEQNIMLQVTSYYRLKPERTKGHKNNTQQADCICFSIFSNSNATN